MELFERCLHLCTRSCVSACSDFAHRYQEYFLPTCNLCATNCFSPPAAEVLPETVLFCASRKIWLCGPIRDSALLLAGFQPQSGSNRGWCNDVTVILQHCSPWSGISFINCKPFYSPMSLPPSVWSMFTVHCRPTCKTHSTCSPTRYCVEQTGLLVTVFCDFKKGNLWHELCKHR